jgi:hypothetical protein
MYFALSRGELEMALVLVKAGADVHCKDKDGYGVLLSRDRHARAYGSLAGMCGR